MAKLRSCLVTQNNFIFSFSFFFSFSSFSSPTVNRKIWFFKVTKYFFNPKNWKNVHIILLFIWRKIAKCKSSSN
jgi:hypothetical protein